MTKDEAFLEWYNNAHWGNEDLKECCHRSWNAAIKQARSAPVQEPVAVVKVLPLGDGHKPMHWADWTNADNPPPEGTLLHTGAPVQEPVGLIESLKDAQPCCGQYEICHRACTPRGKFLGHRDAQRQWVGLTQKDIDIAFDDTQEGGGFDEFARAIEAKLRSKNNG